MTLTPPRPPGEAPSDLLRDLVDAMRQVVEASRDRSLAEMRDAVATETTQLEQELADLAALTSARSAALAARADAYERALASFMEELDAIDDPIAFAAAARRMPIPSAVSAAEPPFPADAQPSRPQPGWPEPSRRRPAPALAAVVPAGAVAAPAVAAVAERNGDTAAEKVVAQEATSIQVRGLSSFGAITSFKHSLEQVDGIRSVSLGLGPGGEFVYTTTHAPTFDLDAAIRAIEDGAEIVRDGGTLRVQVGRKAG